MAKMSKFPTTVCLLIALTFLSTKATMVHPGTSGLKKRNYNPTKNNNDPTTTITKHRRKPSFTLFNWEQSQYLNAHNALRHRVGAPPLIWDATLMKSARKWAMRRRGDCNYRHHSSSIYGENIFWMNYKEFTPMNVVQKWFDEYKLYDHMRNVCKCNPQREGCECGHYLNVIWKTTKRVGCSGAIYCNGQKGVMVVCQYDPAGLTPGVNPFIGW